MAYLDNFNPEKIDSVPEVKQQFRFLKKAIDNGEIGGGGAVDSVNGKIGAVVLNAKDVGAYEKPLSGIPVSDLANSIQIALNEVGAFVNGYLVITEDHTEISSPQQGVIYREQGTDSYTDWMYNGTEWKALATYNGNAAGIENIDKQGFYVTDDDGNIVIQYNTNGFDVASVSDHFKTLINHDIEQTAKDFGYKSAADVLNHLLTMESVREPSYIPELSELENTLLADAKSRIATVNPNGTYFTFAVITDLHQCKDGVTYGDSGHVMTSEPSVKLLGAIAQAANLDCVLCGGDLSTGGDLTFDEYAQQMEVVRGFFQKYINVPYYFTDGNHDRKYNSSVARRTNTKMLKFFKRCNWMTNKAELHYFDTTDGVLPNTYYVDFPDKKVRVIMVSSYEKNQDATSANSCAPLYKCLHDALQFEGNTCTEWSVMTMSHDSCESDRIQTYFGHFMNGTGMGKGAGTDQHVFPAFNNGQKGYAAFAEIKGHSHNSARSVITKEDFDFNRISVANAFSRTDAEVTSDSYCFSIFVADTDNMKMYEFRIGRGGETYEYNITHQPSNEE